MTHYILLKLTPEADAEAAEAVIRNAYRDLEQILPFLRHPRIYRNCIVRDSNADFMIMLELDTRKDLQTYLTHPLHVAMAQTLKDSIAVRISFDHT